MIDKPLKSISENRALLMGIAILWVIFHHCGIYISDNNVITNSNFLTYILKFPIIHLGYGGVDIFVFLSGFGIYLSLKKNPDIYTFLLKRIKRFSPAIPLILLLLFFKKIFCFHEIIAWLTLQNYWIEGHSNFNYLSYQFLFYLISPILVNIIDKHLTTKKAIAAFLAFLFILTIPYWHDLRLMGVSRVIIYTIGLLVGRYYYRKKEPSRNIVNLLKALSALGFIALIFVFLVLTKERLSYGLAFYPFVIIVPGLLITICEILESSDRYSFLGFIKTILNFFGKNSLQFYCINILAISNIIAIQGICHYFVLSIIPGILYSFLINSINKIK